MSSFWAAAEDEAIDEVRFLLRQGERRQTLEMLGAGAIDLVAISR